MELKGMAPNETIQLHELLTFKNLCLTKSVTMSPLVSDEELKAIMKQDVTATKQHINELRKLMEQSSIATSEPIQS
jgi:similar to spore coat protein